MSTFLAELLGTALLILLGDGVVAGVLLRHSKSENAGWAVICIGWALAVTFAIYLVGGVSGAHLNPAVTLALAAAGQFDWANAPAYIAGQMLGAVLGACLVYLQYLPHWAKTEDKSAKLAVFCTAPAIRHTTSNLVAEFIGTFVLVLGLMSLGSNFADGLKPLVVGGLIVAIGFSLGGPTGWAINPARDLGPRIAHAFLPIPGKGDSDWPYSWVPVVGPIAGGVSAALFYTAVFG